MAWYFSSFANQIIEAGKAIYPLPMFVNAALNRPNVNPGDYPSGGPLPHLMDIWKAGGPFIDFLSPDFYFPDIKHWSDLYTCQNDPLFIPEHRFDETVAAKAIFTIGHYNCLGFSPFSIESTNQPEKETLGKSYRFAFKHDYTLGWSADAKNEEWPLSAGLIIKTGQNEYYIAGTGMVTTRFRNWNSMSMNEM